MTENSRVLPPLIRAFLSLLLIFAGAAAGSAQETVDSPPAEQVTPRGWTETDPTLLP